MGRRFATRGHVISSPRRQMVWLGSDFTVQTIVGTTPLLLTTLNAAALALRPFTIVRTRMFVQYRSDQSSADEANQAVFSEQVVTEPAAATSIAGVPTPLQETDSDFHVYVPMAFDFKFGTNVGFQEHQGLCAGFVVDSKSMRKVGNDDDVVQVVEQAVTNGGLIAAVGRTLIKLH